MRKHIQILCFLLLLGYLSPCAGAADQLEDFSADMVSRSRAGEFKGKIFVSGEKSRMEAEGVVTITRMDKSAVLVLMPEQKMYMEMPLDAKAVDAAKGKMPGELERTRIGQDTIDGKQADKYRVVYENNNQKVSAFIWIVKGFKIPVRTAAEDGSWMMEYRNIALGRQPDSLFELPPGYEKFSYQGLDMKGLMQGAQGMMGDGPKGKD